MQRFPKFFALVPFVLVIGCTDSNKAPAEAAVKAAEAALATLGPDASAYAPEGVAAVRKSYATAKELIGTKEYEGALKAASGIPGKVNEVIAAAAAKKAELAKAWGEASEKVAATVSAVKSRIAALGQAKKLPAGIDKAAIAKANEEVASIESGLAKLSEDAKGGKITEAVAAAKDLQAKGEAILKSLGAQ
jgi:hypothetical protein